MTLIVRLSNVFSTDNPFQALPSTPTPADRKSKLVKSDRQTRSQPSSRRTGGSLLNLHRQAQSWSGLSDSQSSRHRKATKAALSLAQLILDPPDADIRPPAPTHRTSPKAEGRRGGGGSSVGNSLSTSTRKTTVPRLREKDVARLRTQLLKPESAGLVIAQARRLNKGQIQHDQLYQQNGHIAPNGVEPTRAVCLDCDESKAEDLIRHAAKTQKARMQQEIQLGQHKYSTLKTMPPAPARLPVLLSLLEPLEPARSDAKRNSDAHLGKLEDALISLRMEEADSEDSSQGPMLPFGLMLPPSAMSLHRPLAGALPTADTLRRGFDALLNAESKVYMYEGPSHKGMHPPTDRLSIYTYWWGFELVMPPPTIVYLSHVKEISTSLLNLLGVIVYAVPGGTRELAPFVGVMSRFIETEWNMLKAQDHGKGVVCAATWFIPAALVARPWDFDDGDRDSSLRIAHKKIK